MNWISNLGIRLTSLPDSGEVDLFNTGIPFTLGKISQTDDEEAEETNASTLMLKDIDTASLPQTTYAEKFVAPSHKGSNVQGRVALVARRNQRIPLRGNSNMSEVGNCIHNIYAACRYDETQNLAMARRMIDSFQFEHVLPDASAILDARQYLVQWLTDRFGNCIATYHELPFIHKQGEQLVRGSMDWVWETKEGCVLIDYKTFPGTETSVTDEENTHFAGLYKPQFDCYRAALEAAGKRVIGAYVYYPIHGMIVEILD